jgi:hypothetical protein
MCERENNLQENVVWGIDKKFYFNFQKYWKTE